MFHRFDTCIFVHFLFTAFLRKPFSIYIRNIFQTFRKVDCSKYSEVSDVKFKFFIEEVHKCAVLVRVYTFISLTQILPYHSSPLMAQTAIFIASYPDFIRLRNYLSREEKSFTQICE